MINYPLWSLSLPHNWGTKWTVYHQLRDTCCHLANLIEEVRADWCRRLPNHFGPCFHMSIHSWILPSTQCLLTSEKSCCTEKTFVGKPSESIWGDWAKYESLSVLWRENCIIQLSKPHCYQWRGLIWVLLLTGGKSFWISAEFVCDAGGGRTTHVTLLFSDILTSHRQAHSIAVVMIRRRCTV